MSIYVYKVVHDTGFAPNPFHGFCTLACCKPRIRAGARVGDWVVGATPKSLGRRLTYAMRVSDVLTFEAYFGDPRFAPKKPRRTDALIANRCGDNCYEPLGNGEFRQLESEHYDTEGRREDAWLKRHDLSGRHVLISNHFAYFGAEATEVPPTLAFMIPGRGHRVKFTVPEEREILEFVEGLPLGVLAPPRTWKAGDESWKD